MSDGIAPLLAFIAAISLWWFFSEIVLLNETLLTIAIFVFALGWTVLAVWETFDYLVLSRGQE